MAWIPQLGRRVAERASGTLPKVGADTAKVVGPRGLRGTRERELESLVGVYPLQGGCSAGWRIGWLEWRPAR
jgi:hypothetical protein